MFPLKHRRARKQRDMITLGGWLFADLLLGLAMLFFAALRADVRRPRAAHHGSLHRPALAVGSGSGSASTGCPPGSAGAGVLPRGPAASGGWSQQREARRRLGGAAVPAAQLGDGLGEGQLPAGDRGGPGDRGRGDRRSRLDHHDPAGRLGGERRPSGQVDGQQDDQGGADAGARCALAGPLRQRRAGLAQGPTAVGARATSHQRLAPGSAASARFGSCPVRRKAPELTRSGAARP